MAVRLRNRFLMLSSLLALTVSGADTPRTVIDLQPFRETQSSAVKSRTGREGAATLVNLNPAINSWYLLRVQWKGGAESVWHLENAKPGAVRFALDSSYAYGIQLVQGKARSQCQLFGSPDELEQARSSPLVYYPLCGAQLYLLNPAKGKRSTLESTVEFLRDNVWGGEQVIDVFHHLLADRYRETAEVDAQPAARAPSEGPLPALVDEQYAKRSVVARDLGIRLESAEAEKSGMTPGAWYEAQGNPGIRVSIIEPDFIAAGIRQSYRNLVNPLDKVESSSLCYLASFELDRFDVGFQVGTDHPRVNWSDRVTGAMRPPGMPGPDGFDTIAPLVRTGQIRPDLVPLTVAAFTGGFKRTHGAFHLGELGQRNYGSHYGFIENGVVLSTLEPGLATVYVLDDGTIGMKTWTDADNTLLRRIHHARQNGVPIIEAGAPGKLVASWGLGNWSGSANEKLRTMRAGLALGSNQGRQYLIYAVFSDSTPSAMARVFQAYRVNYAMLLDMNALEHTYLAVYRRSGGELAADHIITGMNVLDKLPSGEPAPRFLAFPDNRDFFYLTRRK